MPSGYGPWQAEDRGHGGGLLLAAAAAGAIVFGVVEIVTSAAFAIAVSVAVPVVAALIVAGTVRIVRELWSTRGMLWKPPLPVEEAVPVPALPVAVALAIEAPRPVLTGVVIDHGERVAALAEAGD